MKLKHHLIKQMRQQCSRACLIATYIDYWTTRRIGRRKITTTTTTFSTTTATETTITTKVLMIIMKAIATLRIIKL